VAINYTGFTTRSEFTYDGLSRMVKIVERTGGTINSTRKFVWVGQEKWGSRWGQLFGWIDYSAVAQRIRRINKANPAGLRKALREMSNV